ncbi:methionine synthase [Acrocarpospora phusangensis]|nr:methionine synthase [Acrocarpospora phusangensis]
MTSKLGLVTDFPWDEGAATGVGSHPGEDGLSALKTVFDEVPVPYLPELPGRGVGADMIGRTASLLVDLPVEVQPSGWRFSDRPGRDFKRARDHLLRDLDMLEEVSQGYTGALKIQVCGPWTLAGAVELRHGDKTLADKGAVRDLIDSLADGLAAHVADVRKRVPGAGLIVQVDEPGLPGVLAGTVPTASGFGRLAAVEEQPAADGLRRVLAVTPFPIVHCCAPRVPFSLFGTAGARGISLDASLLRRADEDRIGETVEAGIALLLGVLPGVDSRLPEPAAVAHPARELWRRLGFRPEELARQVLLTPSCGLAGASPAYAKAALVRCREAARVLREDPEAE